MSRHALGKGLPCPKKLCYTDCICEESLSVTFVHKVPQQHHTKRKGIRGLKHFRPDSPSHLANTKEPQTQLSPASYSMVLGALYPQIRAELLGQGGKIWLSAPGVISLELEEAQRRSEQIHSKVWVLLRTKPSALPRKQAPCSCEICTPKLPLVH